MTVHRTGRVLRPDRPRRPDRLRRGLPDRRLGRRGPGRLPHRPRRRHRRRWCPQPLQRLRGLYVARPTRAVRPARGQHPRQHRAPLRPVQRPVPAVPRRDDELLVALFARSPSGDHDVAADLADRRPGPQDRAAARRDRRRARARGCSRSAPAGASSRSAPPAAGRRVRSVTLSTEQQALARERIAAAGLADRVDVELCDYRAVAGEYDAVLLGGDDRGGRPRVLVDVLLHPRPAARARRPGRDPGDHDAARPDARHPRLAHLDQQVHLPRRLPAVGRGDRRDHPARHDAAAGRPAGVRRATTPRRCASGTRRSWPRPTGARRSASTRRSARMWHFYLEYSRAGFASGYLDVQQLVLARPE